MEETDSNSPNRAPPEVYVTNFHRRMTGVSATADAVISKQKSRLRLRLVGNSLPNGPPPDSYRAALRSCRHKPADRPFSIWHVRRNIEMSAAIFARDILRLPVRIVFTSAAQRRHSAVPRALIRQMDAVVATTEYAGSLIPKLAAVVPHGVDIDQFVPADDRQACWKELGFPGKFGIGIVGRIRQEKGTDLFVESICRVLPNLPDFSAVILGRAMPTDAGFEQQLKERIEQTGLSDRVLFLGEQPREQMPAIMRGLSMLVAPARYEGYGMTPLEAMASGVAVVATDTGVYRSIIVDNETGLVTPIGDQDALTHAIRSLANDPQRLHAMGAIARQVAVDHLSLDGEIDGYAAVYERLWNGETFAA